MRRKQDIVGLQIDDFPLDLKKRLIRAANKAGTNMSDVAVESLAADFNIAFTPSGRRPIITPGDSTSIMFKMPRKLRLRIKSAALNADCAARDIVISHLRVKFG